MSKRSKTIVRLMIGCMIFGALWIGSRVTPSLSSSPATRPLSTETPAPFDLYLPVISVEENSGTIIGMRPIGTLMTIPLRSERGLRRGIWDRRGLEIELGVEG